MHASIVNETSLNIIYGSIFAIRKSLAKLIDD